MGAPPEMRQPRHWPIIVKSFTFLCNKNIATSDMQIEWRQGTGHVMRGKRESYLAWTQIDRDPNQPLIWMIMMMRSEE